MGESQGPFLGRKGSVMKAGGIQVRLPEGASDEGRENEVSLHLGCFPGGKEKSMPPSAPCKQSYQKEEEIGSET